MEKSTSKFRSIISVTPKLAFIIMCLVAFFLWSSLHRLEYNVDNIELRTINLKILDQNGGPIHEASIKIGAQYSFDKVKPTYQITFIKPDELRIAIAYSRAFKLTVDAKGYHSKTCEYNENSPTDLEIVLQEIS